MSNIKLNLERKISPKSIIGNVKALAKKYKNGERVELYTVIGSCTDIKTGTTAHGDYVGFIGSFEAVNLLDNKGYTSKECFIPEPYSSVLHDAVKNEIAESAKNGGEIKTVDFALKILIEIDENQSTGYIYHSESLLEMTPTSALDHLRGAMQSVLDAPRTTAKLEDKTDEKDDSKDESTKGKKEKSNQKENA